MFQHFENYIRQETDISDKEIELIRSLATEKTLQRKDFLFQQGDVCRHKVFITKGLLRTYRIGEPGDEHIMQFSCENSWITDPDSFEQETPSLLNMDAVEHSHIVYWNREDLQYMINNISGLKAYFERLISRSGNIFRQRILSNISLSAEEKYEEFVKKYPEINARVPLHMVASYLGVTRETLTRIRRAQLEHN